MSDQPNSAPASNRRSVRNVLINRPLQREFTLVMLMIMMAAAFAIGVTVHFTLQALTEDAPPTISRMALEQMVLDANSQLMVISILIVFLAVVVTGFFAIFFLHRVAGPVHRFRQVLKRMGSGEIPASDVHLRKRDFFKETADELNKVIHLLRDLDSTSQKIDDLIKEIPAGQLAPGVQEKIRQIHNSLSQLRKAP